MAHNVPPPTEIARHTVRGSVYSVTASAITIGLGLLRTYLMVTFLLPEEVGAAALAMFYVELAQQVGSFGLDSAFIHKPDVGDRDLRTFQSMYLLTGAGALALIFLAAPLIARFNPAYGDLQVLIWVISGLALLRTLNRPEVAALEKGLAFSRIALLDVSGAVVRTIIGPGMALLGFGAWAVIGEFAGGVLARLFVLRFRFRAAFPRPGWDRASAAWFWAYGKRLWMSTNLTFLIDHFDDFWVGTTLGKSPLGLYSKAYEFSRYPRRVIANPILSVFFPTFAHLQTDRLRLSRAFFRATSLIVRAGGILAVTLLITAPEFFRLFLPEAWLPMQLTFQLMVVYTFLDPVATAAQQLLVATGRAAEVTRTRWIQFLIFVPAVIFGADRYGIEGVAVAADLMLLAGAALLFRDTRLVVDYSMRSLWQWPLLAAAGIGSAGMLLSPWLAQLPDAWALAAKLIAVPVLFVAFLLLVERGQLMTGIGMLRGILGRRRAPQNENTGAE